MRNKSGFKIVWKTTRVGKMEEKMVRTYYNGSCVAALKSIIFYTETHFPSSG